MYEEEESRNAGLAEGPRGHRWQHQSNAEMAPSLAECPGLRESRGTPNSASLPGDSASSVCISGEIIAQMLRKHAEGELPK